MGPFHSRTHPRRRSYDYAQPGAYFVTTITHQRRPILGVLARDGVVLTHAGQVVQRYWATVSERFPGVTIDTFVVMPDHVHAIVVLSSTLDRTVSLSQVVGWAKQRASREINSQMPIPFIALWQRSFHDAIIRDADAFVRIRRYVTANPVHAWNAAHIGPSSVGRARRARR